MNISVVIPVYNEEGNVGALHSEVLAVLKKIRGKHEIIFVNDASSDGTVNALSKLSPITILSFGRNTGQAAALKAGFDYATGDVVVSLDGDLQNDPADIPKLLAKLDEGYDCVSGWRKHRKDSFMKRMVSRFGVRLHHLLIKDEVHDSGCTLKAYKAWCVKDLELFGQMHRFLPALLKLKGARVGEVVTNHRSRGAGVSKYNLLKVIPGFLDLWLVWFWQKYASRPIHILGFLSVIVTFFGFLMGAWALWLKLNGTDLSNTFLPNIAVFSVMIGLQLLVTGVLADIMIKNYYSDKKPYFVREVIKN